MPEKSARCDGRQAKCTFRLPLNAGCATWTPWLARLNPKPYDATDPEPCEKTWGLQERNSYMRKVLAIVTCAAFLLGACQTQNAYTGEQQTSDATRGAIIGGLLIVAAT